MKIDLKKLLNASVDSIPFEGCTDLSREVFFGAYPFRTPARYYGEITNLVDVLRLTGTITATYETVCARCLQALEISVTAEADFLLVQKEDDREGDIIALEGDQIDPEDVLVPALFLEIDMAYLCKQDCKGLCPHCGADRNATPCDCDEKQIDDRLAVLKTLLNKQQDN